MFAEDPKVVDKLRRQVTSGAAFMSGQEPKLQDIEIEFQGHARLYLEENPFNRSMQIGKTKDGMFTVKLKAEVNQMLFNWVVSFSDVARVIKPVSLRKWLKEYAEYLMENYG
jgi:predicted DNA-binding transcriptional regulator YafY